MISIIIILIALVLGAGFIWFLFTFLEVLRIVIALVAIPPLVKIFSDYIGKWIDVEKNVGLVLGFLFSIPLAVFIYQNFWLALFVAISLWIIFGIVKAFTPKIKGGKKYG